MEDVKKLEKIFKAVANRKRLEILKYLKKEKEASVIDIAEHVKLSHAAVSKHLIILAKADILDREQKRFYGFYSLRSDQGPIIRDLLSKL